MVDEVAEILGELDAAPVRPEPRRALRAAPVQAAAVNDPRDRLVPLSADSGSRPGVIRHAVEAVAVGRDGGVLLIGWLDDTDCPLDYIVVSCPAWRITFDAASLVRVRRTDVDEALQTGAVHMFGYFGLVTAAALRDVPASVQVELHLKNGGSAPSAHAVRGMTAEALRDLVLGYLASAAFLGNPQAEAVAALDHGLGAQVVALNRTITERITAARHVERFGVPGRQPAGSIVVCLYGKAEFLFVQNALFAGRKGIEDYEFIYVCNSPEITDTLLAEARTAQMIYGLRQTIVLLPGNAGFGAANNAGATAALGRRILCVNPDVFPRQLDWAAQHTALVDTLPAEQTRLFGVPLYYDDGSLMHGGMHFELDPAVVMRPGGVGRQRLARVEHYGKGAPASATTFTMSRPVPAITGAFMSADRDWYQTLGGFNEDYVFGHYEDADLCLKSFARGTPPWLHDLRLWHLEGKGSTRRSHHEGGSLVNRWLFTRQWAATISDRMCGPAPTHPAMTLQGEATPPAPKRRRGRPEDAA
jgi:GT2 family glycosyltransferase